MTATKDVMFATPTRDAQDDRPQERVYLERIGDSEYKLVEAKLDIFDDVCIWENNPRVQPALAGKHLNSEEDLEHELRQTSGYGMLLKSIEDLGQMEPVYAWKRDDQDKYIIFEGSTRVAILRELHRRHANGPKAAKYRHAKAKILPAEFTPENRAVLLAKIHVRGTGVRAWGRYIQAKFVYENVTERNGAPAIMSVSDMARYMEKHISFVQRLRDAYEVSRRFVEHVDTEDAEQVAAAEFSTLEEISKSAGVGPKLRDWNNTEWDQLRGDVFDMVRNRVFKEYRDARFMKQFYEDPEKWAALKSGTEGIANQLAADIKKGGTSLKGKISTLPAQLERALEKDAEVLGEADLEDLRKATRIAEKALNAGLGDFRIALVGFTRALEEAPLSEIKSVQRTEYDGFKTALADFESRLDRHKTWM